MSDRSTESDCTDITLNNRLSGAAEHICVLIPAAGRGIRMGKAENKLFLKTGGKPILLRTLEAFQNHPRVTDICLVTNPCEQDLILDMIRSHDLDKVTVLAYGGATRGESVLNGLNALRAAGLEADAIVMVHDGARCFVGSEVIERAVNATPRYGAIITALPTRDTIKYVDDSNRVTDTPNRAQLRQVQTPQSFRFEPLLNAYEQFGTDLTDDAAVMERAGYSVHVIPGSDFNIKVTTPVDLLIAEALVTYLEL